MKKIVLILCLVLVSCSVGKSVVWEENPTAFKQMMAVARPALIKYEIIDEHGTWYEPVLVNPFNKLNDVNFAQTILDKLSPSFLYPNSDPKLLAPSLKDMFSTGEKLSMGSHAFIIERAAETIEVELVARSEAKTSKWLVQCKVISKIADASTLYYLLMSDPLNSVNVVPVVLAKQSCENSLCNSSGEYIHTGDYELPTIEVEQGEKNILDPGFSQKVVEDAKIEEKKLAN